MIQFTRDLTTFWFSIFWILFIYVQKLWELVPIVPAKLKSKYPLGTNREIAPENNKSTYRVYCTLYSGKSVSRK